LYIIKLKPTTILSHNLHYLVKQSMNCHVFFRWMKQSVTCLPFTFGGRESESKTCLWFYKTKGHNGRDELSAKLMKICEAL